VPLCCQRWSNRSDGREAGPSSVGGLARRRQRQQRAVCASPVPGQGACRPMRVRRPIASASQPRSDASSTCDVGMTSVENGANWRAVGGFMVDLARTSTRGSSPSRLRWSGQAAAGEVNGPS
jgi:hypothetical protein